MYQFLLRDDGTQAFPYLSRGCASLLGIPANLKVMAIVPFGYPAVRVGKGRKNRKPFNAVVSSERYGEPLT